MSFKIVGFEKNGKKHPVIELRKDGTESAKYPGFSFGVEKAKLILQHMTDIQEFVEAYRKGSEGDEANG